MKLLTKWLLLACFALISCDQWLDIKADMKQVVPQTIDEFQALLDHTNRINVNKMSPLLEISTDNLYLTEPQWNSRRRIEDQNSYIWAQSILEGGADLSYIAYYEQVYYANTVLDGVEKIIPRTQQEVDKRNNVAGSALFIRAWAFYHLAQLYSPQYQQSNLDADLGIPLRTSSVVDQNLSRSTIREVYNQLLSDLNLTLEVLPDRPSVPTRPSKWASHALLARIYLQMGSYERSLDNVEKAMEIDARLMDYNMMDASIRFPFARFNMETIFYQTVNPSGFYVAPELYGMYGDGDLRKLLFFYPEGEYHVFKGSYSNSSTFFAGLAVDELYLIRAECLARLSREAEAREILNYFMAHRYRADSGYSLVEKDDILENVLSQRRMQLIYRGTRWQDLRRLNLEPDRQVTLTRELGDRVFTLAPNSPRYVFAIPDDVVSRNPGIRQNKR